MSKDNTNPNLNSVANFYFNHNEGITLNVALNPCGFDNIDGGEAFVSGISPDALAAYIADLQKVLDDALAFASK